jgi:hypothetical protein
LGISWEQVPNQIHPADLFYFILFWGLGWVVSDDFIVEKVKGKGTKRAVFRKYHNTLATSPHIYIIFRNYFS